MDLDTVIYLAVYGTVTGLQVFSQNILNCVPKTNKAFTGLERQVINDKIFILEWSMPLMLDELKLTCLWYYKPNSDEHI